MNRPYRVEYWSRHRVWGLWGTYATAESAIRAIEVTHGLAGYRVVNRDTGAVVHEVTR